MLNRGGDARMAGRSYPSPKIALPHPFTSTSKGVRFFPFEPGPPALSPECFVASCALLLLRTMVEGGDPQESTRSMGEGSMDACIAARQNA